LPVLGTIKLELVPLDVTERVKVQQGLKNWSYEKIPLYWQSFVDSIE
jgi:hypothetical protein